MDLMASAPNELQLYTAIQASTMQVMQRLVLGHRPTHERYRLCAIYSQAHFRGVAASVLPIKLGHNKVRFTTAVSAREPLLFMINQAITEVLTGIQDDRDSIMKEWLKHCQGNELFVYLIIDL
jgi:hypothetical protein